MPYEGKVLFGPGPPDFRLIRRGHLWTVHVAFWKQRPAHEVARMPDYLVLGAMGTWAACGVGLVSGTGRGANDARFVWLEEFQIRKEAKLCRNCLRVAEARQWLLDGNWKLDPETSPQFDGGDPMYEMDSDVMRMLARAGRGEYPDERIIAPEGE